jgi:hypothetical protein
MDLPLLHTALRVLSCYRDAQCPDDADVLVLQSTVTETERNCEPDCLAVQVIEREIQKH